MSAHTQAIAAGRYALAVSGDLIRDEVVMLALKERGALRPMALAGPDAVRVVNSPIHTAVPGRERPSANHLGVRAAP